MLRFIPFKKKEKRLKSEKLSDSKILPDNQMISNQLEISIGGIMARLSRNNTAQPQNELTVVIPRAEIRRKYYNNGRLIAEEEIILNSITLVDAPLHTPEGK
ncbi:hypothetical protein L7E55_11790 [Pelotomaculum isophthalicicum JI]|uniref:Uncharacterized protein n=1 Tax=Pelotomaculum isophthalicicum JI TaxID=947010 RepID=A0A9X4H8L5_9FIRM|nr:hypothetical protein [Pelotomaculum isophthalicicum]MDF9409034.1 hypothetical protein [Pelotomaculum isophthalicicum JI]